MNLPLGRFEVRGEFMWSHNETRELVASGASTGATLRQGLIEGFGGYAQVGCWVWGTPRINGRPGYEIPADLHPVPINLGFINGIEVLVRAEALVFNYMGGYRTDTTLTPADGQRTVMAIDGTVNYWATRHVHLGLEYRQYIFPNQPGATTGFYDNHAHGPFGSTNALGELNLRLGITI
jgi:hypothetical protein